MDYGFNPEIAVQYGVNEAIFIHNLYWWIAKNEANGRHYYDEKSWTYNSMEAFSKLFPFWTIRQIRTIIAKLEANGVIYTGNYNKKSFDKTKWYALSEDVLRVYQSGKSIRPKSQMHVTEKSDDVTEKSHAYDQKVTPIPDSKPDSKPTDINTDIKQVVVVATQPPKNVKPLDTQLQQLCNFYQKNIGIMPPIVLEQIAAYIGHGIEHEAIRYAIGKAVGGGYSTSNWRYIDGILRQWLKGNIRTLAQAEAEQAQRSGQFSHLKSMSKSAQSKNPTSAPSYDIDEIERLITYSHLSSP